MNGTDVMTECVLSVLYSVITSAAQGLHHHMVDLSMAH